MRCAAEALSSAKTGLHRERKEEGEGETEEDQRGCKGIRKKERINDSVAGGRRGGRAGKEKETAE